MNSSNEPLLYKDGVIKFRGKEIKSESLASVRGDWLNGMSNTGHCCELWMVVFDDYIILGDQVREHNSRDLKKWLIKEHFTGVEFLGTRYKDPEEIFGSDVKIIVNGQSYYDSNALLAVKNNLFDRLKRRFDV